MASLLSHILGTLIMSKNGSRSTIGWKVNDISLKNIFESERKFREKKIVIRTIFFLVS